MHVDGCWQLVVEERHSPSSLLISRGCTCFEQIGQFADPPAVHIVELLGDIEASDPPRRKDVAEANGVEQETSN